ncbi:MAG: hypothetical protein KAR35_10620 [Candidatus Heimdallarchaeota archaeon]|nr:hypothetical protein [Candidatus Heimdallarchaeota archaeon]MCK5049811.1 hypothetical protein [Candidatus Heimdallarchaeota archaeon]
MFIRKQEHELKEERTIMDRIPPLSILVGGIVFLVGTISAILIYETPNGEYDFLKQFFSELGIRKDYLAEFGDGTTEFRYAPENPELFNLSLWLSGLLMAYFFIFSFRQMRNNNRFSNFFLFLSTLTGITAGFMLMGVGLYDLSNESDTIWQTHGFWVIGLYSLLTITSVLWYFMLLSSNNLPYRDKTKWIFLDYLFLIILTILTIVNITDATNLLNVGDIPYMDQYPIETYQKIIAYLFFMYYGLVVGGRLSKTKYDNTPVKKVEPIKKSDKLVCDKCGIKSPEGSPYCTKCGTKL